MAPGSLGAGTVPATTPGTSYLTTSPPHPPSSLASWHHHHLHLPAAFLPCLAPTLPTLLLPTLPSPSRHFCFVFACSWWWTDRWWCVWLICSLAKQQFSSFLSFTWPAPFLNAHRPSLEDLLLCLCPISLSRPLFLPSSHLGVPSLLDLSLASLVCVHAMPPTSLTNFCLSLSPFSLSPPFLLTPAISFFHTSLFFCLSLASHAMSLCVQLPCFSLTASPVYSLRTSLMALFAVLRDFGWVDRDFCFWKMVTDGDGRGRHAAAEGA